MKDKTFVFICGLHRSGTSLLFQGLRDHPMISGFRNTGVSEDEGQLLQSVFPPARTFGGPGRFGFDPNSYLNELSPIVSEENAVRLFQEWSKYWDLSKPVLLEKSPPNLVRTRFLQALFPNSYFIVILRHPVAVAYAMRKWELKDTESLLKHWIVCHKVFEKDKEHLRRLHILKYETFVSDPVKEWNGICDFLQLPTSAARISVHSGINAQYFQQWSREEQTKFSYLEKEILPFGYSLIDLNFCLPYSNHAI